MKNYIGRSINANYINGIETLTGKLVFKDDGFSFKANSVNGNLDKGMIKYKDIQTVELVNTVVIIPNGILVKTSTTNWKFVVSNRKQVAEFLLSKKSEVCG